MISTRSIRSLKWVAITILIAILLITLFYQWYDRRYKASIDERLSTPAKERRKILLGLYHMISEAALRTNTRPFIVYGTLLGYVREKDLICYDFDLDFGISEDEYEAIQKEVIRQVNAQSDQYRVDVKDFLHYRSIEIIHIESRISADIFTFTSEETKSNTVSRSVPSLYSLYYLKECAANMPREWIYPLQQVDFLGNKIYIPNQSEKLLECYYGPNFMTPNKTCDAECNHCVTKDA